MPTQAFDGRTAISEIARLSGLSDTEEVEDDSPSDEEE